MLEIYRSACKGYSSPEMYVRHGVCSSSDSLLARLAVPDSDRVSLNRGLSAESADIFGVLGDFHLLDLLTQGSTVSVIQKAASVFCPHPQLQVSIFVLSSVAEEFRNCTKTWVGY